MPFESYKAREAERRERIVKYADEAEKYMSMVDLKRYPNLHISKALGNMKEGRERDRMFGEIRRELNRRQKKWEKQNADRKEAERQIHMEEAEEHEKSMDPHRHDKDTDWYQQ